MITEYICDHNICEAQTDLKARGLQVFMQVRSYDVEKIIHIDFMVSASGAYAKLFFRTAKIGSERARVCVYLCIGQIQVDGRSKTFATKFRGKTSLGGNMRHDFASEKLRMKTLVHSVLCTLQPMYLTL